MPSIPISQTITVACPVRCKEGLVAVTEADGTKTMVARCPACRGDEEVQVSLDREIEIETHTLLDRLAKVKKRSR